MAMEDALKPAANDPEVQLSQFLFVGKVYPNYQPGNWFVHKYFCADNVQSIERLAGDTTKQLSPIELIKKAAETNLVPNPETLVFALAVCCRQKESESLRHAAYAALGKICSSPSHFILFIKFACQLNKPKELSTTPQHGWGHGFRKAVNNWYLSKEPLELAKCVTRYRSRYGWKHKDIIKLSHPTTDNFGKKAVLKYIMYGLEEAKKEFAEKPEAVEILQYIEKVEDFKHCQDELKAACLLEKYELTLDHVPGHLLKSGEVWNSLIPSMDLITLLNNLQRIHNLGLLKPEAPAVAKIIDQVTSADNVIRDKVHPAFVFITLRNYENSGKTLSYEKQKIKEQAKKPLPPTPKPNGKIIDALYKSLDLSFAHLEPTGLRYMVTINMNKTMFNTRAWRSGNVSGAEAGYMIALSLLHSEKNVTVAIFKNVGIHIVNFDKTLPFGQAVKKLQQTPVGVANLSKPISWAIRRNNKYDVFINVVDEIFLKHDTSELALTAYKTKLNLPQTKLINCAVCCSKTYKKCVYDKNVLTINGFDATVPTVMRAFAKSLF